jgi:1-deoxy-D-xylulose-5-phosphate reductoisomerase
LKLAYESGRAGGTAPAVFNAANEVAVARFLKGDIRFLQIEDVIYDVLASHETVSSPALDDILAADEWARRQASAMKTPS